jgi:CO dehydrogenase maturation factor
MKMVILGKGGSGKSTVSALLARGLARKGYSVLVIDSDESNFGLHRQLGMEEPRELMEQLGGRRGAGRQIMESAREGKSIGPLDGNFGTADIPPGCLSIKDGVRLLQIGKVKHFGEGCACPIGVLASDFLERLRLAEREVAIVDTEAGLEHLGRGVERGADLVLMVMDPSFESLRLRDKVSTMLEEAGKPLFFVLNRTRPEYGP